jgi:hypothetical protein
VGGQGYQQEGTAKCARTHTRTCSGTNG